ncbi:MAG: hypothetical protein ABSH05_13845 [Bryobacteraceae bacterium]|jgi:hypothetical protein
MFFRRQPKETTFEERLEALRAAGFETLPEPGGRVKASRNGCAAVIDSGPRIERAGWLVKGEIAALVDGGYQKFWRAAGRDVPALAGQLEVLHDFEEDLREGLGLESLYNTSLGTTNDLHLYDRLAGR